MAAGEDQAQDVVTHGSLLGRFAAAFHQQHSLCVPVLAGGLAAEPVDRTVASRCDDPAGRARRQTDRRPSLGSDGESVLDRLLRKVDVAKSPDQDSHGAAVLLAKDTFNVRSI